jgi:hypothetical protein
MSKESDFLLGTAFSLLDQCRSYFIKNKDKVGLAMIEDQYQLLLKGVDTIIYGREEK